MNRRFPTTSPALRARQRSASRRLALSKKLGSSLIGKKETNRRK